MVMVKKEAELEGVRAWIVQLMCVDKTETLIASDRELHYRNLESCMVTCIIPWNTKKGERGQQNLTMNKSQKKKKALQQHWKIKSKLALQLAPHQNINQSSDVSKQTVQLYLAYKTKARLIICIQFCNALSLSVILCLFLDHFHHMKSSDLTT